LPGVSISQVEVRRNLPLVAVYHRGGKALSEGTIPVLNASDCEYIARRPNVTSVKVSARVKSSVRHV
jgi:hypothetical protein